MFESMLEAHSRNHFEWFNLPARFTLDMDALDRTYRAVQAQIHPDRFATAGTAQKLVATQWTAQVNEAYQVLKNPLKRAIYLLHLRGLDVQAESNTMMEPSFLMQQLSWREQIEEAADHKDESALRTLVDELSDEKRARFVKLEELFEQQAGPQADQAAADAVRQLMFIERVLQEAEMQLEQLVYI